MNIVEKEMKMRKTLMMLAMCALGAGREAIDGKALCKRVKK